MARPRFAITAVFALNGAVFSSWYARLPEIQADLQLGDGALGLTLLGAPAGLLLAQPLAGALSARRGSRAVVGLAPLYIGAVILPAVAVDAPTLFLAVLATGAANGALDIAMNLQGIAVERTVARRIFSSLHAGFSFGALAGAGLAAGAVAAGLSPLAHLVAVAVAGGAAAALLAPSFVGDAGNPQAPLLARPSRRLATIGAIAFCALLAEGAVFDWSSIFLAREAGAAAALAPLGLAAFSLTMGVGRLLGDPLAERVGAARLTRAGALLAAAGLAAGLAIATPVAGVLGFAVMGIGLAVVFPLALRAAGGESVELAAVSTVGYAGFLTGPPAIGLLASATDLGAALGLAAALCVVAALLARNVHA